MLVGGQTRATVGTPILVGRSLHVISTTKALAELLIQDSLILTTLFRSSSIL